MIKEEIITTIKKYEKEYMIFMGIQEFPQYELNFFEITVEEADSAGFGVVARAVYNPKLDKHTLQICTNLELKKYIIFHEFTHILDSEMYAKKDSLKYAYLSGYTEYHASQVELMVLLGADSISCENIVFSIKKTINTFPTSLKVENYISNKHQLAIDLMKRDDFPANIEMLKTAVGVLYNYFGLRSVCKMYSNDFSEKVDNSDILKIYSSQLFCAVIILMEGWFDAAKVELSYGPYSQMIFPIIKEYHLKK